MPKPKNERLGRGKRAGVLHATLVPLACAERVYSPRQKRCTRQAALLNNAPCHLSPARIPRALRQRPCRSRKACFLDALQVQSRACDERVYDATPCPQPKGRATFRRDASRVLPTAQTDRQLTPELLAETRHATGVNRAPRLLDTCNRQRRRRCGCFVRLRPNMQETAKSVLLVPKYRGQLREGCSRVSGVQTALPVPEHEATGRTTCRGGALVFPRLHARASRGEVGTTGVTVAQMRPLSVLLIAEPSPITTKPHSHRPHNVPWCKPQRASRTQESRGASAAAEHAQRRIQASAAGVPPCMIR